MTLYGSPARAIEACIDSMVAEDEAEAVITVHVPECHDSAPCVCPPGSVRYLLVPPAHVGEMPWFMRHLDISASHPHREPFG